MASSVRHREVSEPFLVRRDVEPGEEVNLAGLMPEYRVEQHAAKLGERLEALRLVASGTTIGTTRQDLWTDAVSCCRTYGGCSSIG
jgi:hypothetical protein